MVKKAILQREEKRRLMSEHCREKRQKLRSLSKKKDLSLQERLEVFKQIASLKRDTSPSRRRNRCAITGRPRGYYRRFGLSRIKLRELCACGNISGLKKLSW